MDERYRLTEPAWHCEHRGARAWSCARRTPCALQPPSARSTVTPTHPTALCTGSKSSPTAPYRPTWSPSSPCARTCDRSPCDSSPFTAIRFTRPISWAIWRRVLVSAVARGIARSFLSVTTPPITNYAVCSTTWPEMSSGNNQPAL